MNNNNTGYTYEGILVSIPELKLVGKTGTFKVQEFVVAERVEQVGGYERPARNVNISSGWVAQPQAPTEITAKWVNPVMFSLKGDDADNINGFREGQRVRVYFDIVGRQYNGKVFVELVPFAMETVGTAATTSPTPMTQPQPQVAQPQQYPQYQQPQQQPPQQAPFVDSDPLPF